MGRKSSSDSGIGAIFALICLIFIILGYAICFLEKVNHYNLWKTFWKTTLPLVILNFMGYFVYPNNPELSYILYGGSWFLYAVYWGCVIYDKENEIKQEIVSQIGVETANCPYCGESLPKFPYRKTRCKNCGNFMYVRTRPSDNKRILAREENIEKLQSQWTKKKQKNNIPIIDVSDDMDAVNNQLIEEFPNMFIYSALGKIQEADRLPICKFIWKDWNYRGTDKALIQKYPQYSSDILKTILEIENFRHNTYFRKLDFLETNNELKLSSLPLIKIGWLPSEIYGMAMGICTVDNITKIFDWWLNLYETNREIIEGICIDYLAIPGGPFSEKPEYPIFLFKENDFKKIELKELKKYCKENRCDFPFKEK